MADNGEAIPPPPSPNDLNAKWDACVDLTIRRFVYSTFFGTFGGILLFKSPVTRWASVAFGAGVGIGSAYTQCSLLPGGSSTKPALPNISETTAQVFGDLGLMRTTLLKDIQCVDKIEEQGFISTGDGERKILFEESIRRGTA
ncbi:MICOS complex subunit Mic10 [Senna tora]|uniref:MICOS complex subunit Mic10 n=1 Tax=Senna tora TaxID=362788 RepID=A0A834X0Y7_9FABA|nr:MICOS complex subunit Mic10 [Senna tora]